MIRSAGQALDQLLAAPIGGSVRGAGGRAPREDDAIVLYGAGVLGRTVLRKLRAIGIEPAAFADDTPSKQGLPVDGLQVMTVEQAAEAFGAGLTFVVTILNPALRFLDARRRLISVAPRASVRSFVHLALEHPDGCLPHLQFDRPERVLAEAPHIRRAFALWADEESRRQFVAHLRFRLHADFDRVPMNGGEGYFPRNVVPSLPDETVFVDGGAYDGDSIRSFLDHQDGRFGRIHAFEPDPVNCGRLRAFVGGLASGVGARVHVHHAAVAARPGRLRFTATGDMSAAAASTGNVDVDAVRIQDVVQINREPAYVKLDVEGAERDALEGAAALIADARPLLAISVYHRPTDLWALPLYVESLSPGYRLFLRTEGEDGMDAICFAIPRGGAGR
jgi:FkbM family methyltransferase